MTSYSCNKYEQIMPSYLLSVNYNIPRACLLNPILDGGGGKFAPPPAGFSNIAQKPLGLGS